MGKPVTDVKPETYIYTAILLLLLPIRWITSFFIAVFIHEYCHYIALRLCGATVWQIEIGVTGIVMKTGQLSPGKELICALAGPAGSLALVFLIRPMPFLAVCGLVQGVFNLIPVYPLDGGRILQSAMTLLFPAWGKKVSIWIEGVFVTALFVISVYAFICYKMGTIAWILLAILLYRVINRKNSCKESVMRVQ